MTRRFTISMWYLSLIAGQVAVLLAIGGIAHADETDDLARAVQNPVASMISVPFQANTDFDFGPEEGTNTVMNIQPVLPFKLNDDWNLITRTVIPVISQPRLGPGMGRKTGIGDISFSSFLSPAKPGKWIWGAGPIVVLPTSSDDRLGKDEWGAGVSAVFLTMRGPWVVGSLVSQVWDIDADRGNEIDFFTWQYFINYNLDDGWYLTSSPVITANWEASSGDRWTVPFGGGVGKIFSIGRQALNAQAQIYYNVEKPDFVGDWALRLQLQLLFPK